MLDHVVSSTTIDDVCFSGQNENIPGRGSIKSYSCFTS